MLSEQLPLEDCKQPVKLCNSDTKTIRKWKSDDNFFLEIPFGFG